MGNRPGWSCARWSQIFIVTRWAHPHFILTSSASDAPNILEPDHGLVMSQYGTPAGNVKWVPFSPNRSSLWWIQDIYRELGKHYAYEDESNLLHCTSDKTRINLQQAFCFAWNGTRASGPYARRCWYHCWTQRSHGSPGLQMFRCRMDEQPGKPNQPRQDVNLKNENSQWFGVKMR